MICALALRMGVLPSVLATETPENIATLLDLIEETDNG